jgi:membrane-bound transcription factor site-1 protease
LSGTLNNPGDQSNVIGVGGITFKDEVAKFSSRGMTTWELPEGYGRVKPDIVAYGALVAGSDIKGEGCRRLSGTSVASPVVAGAAVLLASTVLPELRRTHLTPASMKQALVESATRVGNKGKGNPTAGIFEQGFGKVNLLAAMDILKHYQPRASLLPASFDTTDCPYMWPYCAQPIFAGARPIIANITVMNGLGMTGWLEGPPRWEPAANGELLDVSVSWPETMWPWSGWLGVRIKVADEHPQSTKRAREFDGVAEGVVTLTVVSHPVLGSTVLQKTKLSLPLRVKIVKPPQREKRILWDQFHSVAYPTGYIPRDDLYGARV